MSKVNWMVFVSLIVHLQNARSSLPEVPKSPSWTKLQIEKPRTSVIPTWYDVLVSQHIRTPENEIKSKKDKISYANLRESFSLNKLNLPDVVQKNMTLEAKLTEVPKANLTEVKMDLKSGSSGKKMKDLFKNSFTMPNKDLRKNANEKLGELKSPIASGKELNLLGVVQKKSGQEAKQFEISQNSTETKSKTKPGTKIKDILKNSLITLRNETNRNVHFINTAGSTVANEKELNSHSIVQKKINLDGKKNVITDANSTETKRNPKSGAKMKDLFQNSFIVPKEIKQNEKLKYGESTLTNANKSGNKTQNSASNDTVVPLYFPIFRSQVNAKQNQQSILKEPVFVEKELFIRENQESKRNFGYDVLQTTNSAQDSILNKTNKNSRGKKINIKNNASDEANEEHLTLRTHREMSVKSQQDNDQSDLLSFLLQAIKNGDLKLDTKAKLSSKPIYQTEKTCEEIIMTSIPDELEKENFPKNPKLVDFATTTRENIDRDHPQLEIKIPDVVFRHDNTENIICNHEFQANVPKQLLHQNKNTAQEFKKQELRHKTDHLNNDSENNIYNQEYIKKVIEKFLRHDDPANNINSNRKFQNQGPPIELVFRNNDPENVSPNPEVQEILKFFTTKNNPQNINPIQTYPIEGPQQSIFLNKKPEKAICNQEFLNKVPQRTNFENRQQNNNIHSPQILAPNRQFTEADIGQKKTSKSVSTLTLYKPDTVSLWETYGDFMKQFTMTVLVPIYAEKLIAETP